MGASSGKEKNEKSKENENEEKNENKKSSNKEKSEDSEDSKKDSEESGEESDEDSEKKSKKGKKNNNEQEKKIKPLDTEQNNNNKEDSNSEDNSDKSESESKEKSSNQKNKDFSKEDEKEEKEEKESQKNSEKNSSEEEKKEIKKSIPKKEYKDVLPGEIPEERKVSNPFKLSFNYNCCQTIESAHKKEITTMAYILRRNEIATGSVDETIKIWKINTDKNKITLNKELKGHTDSILCIKDFPKINCFCSTSADCTLKLWNCSTLKCMNTLNYHTKCVLTCCYNPSGKFEIFSGGEDSLIVIWASKKEKSLENYEKKYVLKGHKKIISALTYVDDYDYLISGSDDKTLRIWEMKNLDDIKCIKVIKELMSPIDFLLYLDNRLMASCEDGVISFIKMNKKKRCRSVKFSNSPVYCFNIFHKHKYLLVGSKDGKARIWKIGTNKRGVLKGHTKAVTGVTDFEEDFIITSSIDCSIKLWKKE